MYHVIYIHTHDSGRYFSPYGYQTPTPHIMELAQDSLVFRNAHCAGPTCSPSRAGLLSGQAPHSCGMLGLAHRGFSMNDYSRHLSHFLKNHGYHTVLSGFQHEAADNSPLGYEEIITDSPAHPHRDSLPEGLNSDFYNAANAADYLRSYHGDKPMFLTLGMTSTHRVYADYHGYIDPKYVVPPFPIADTPENRADMAGYMRSVQIVDDCVGEIVAALKETGMYDNAFILFTTDHGIAMPYMKCNLYDTGTGVGMIVRHPQQLSSGCVTDSLVSQLDIYPTICDIMGIEKPDYLQGTSLVPVFENPEAEVNDYVYSEVTYHAAYEPMRCIRSKNYKLIERYDDHNSYVPANIDAGAPKTLVMESGLLGMTHEREQLFDLRLDPVERWNLVDNPAYKEVYQTLYRQLARHMEETDDPLLHYRNRVPAPAGAKVTTRESPEPDAEDTEFE